MHPFNDFYAGGLDYIEINETVLFEKNQSHCVVIQVVDDGLGEEKEEFTVVIVLNDVVISSVIVSIISDGEYILLVYLAFK